DPALLPTIVAERTTHFLERRRECAVAHHDVRPDRLEQLLLRDHALSFLDQVLEQPEGGRLEEDRPLGPSQLESPRIELETPEAQHPGAVGHDRRSMARGPASVSAQGRFRYSQRPRTRWWRRRESNPGPRGVQPTRLRA